MSQEEKDTPAPTADARSSRPDEPRAGGAQAGRAAREPGLAVRDEGSAVREGVLAEPDQLPRRDVLKLLGASAALALGAPGCDRKPARKILSMPETPEYRYPGKVLYYASTWTEGQVPYGMMVRAVEGRPIKVEGLPTHPLNRGSSDAAMQASILSLYDPERLRAPRRGEAEVSWKKADEAIVAALRDARSVVILTRASLGPSERALVAEFLAKCPAALTLHLVHEPAGDGPRRGSWKKLYGADGEIRPRLSRAKVLLSLDADFLGTDGAVLEATREFASTRRPAPARGGEPAGANLSRLWVVESAMTVTGSSADHRIPLRASRLGELARALREAVAGRAAPLEAFAKTHSTDPHRLAALAADLREHKSGAVVLAGPHLPESVHATVARLNQDLGAPGSTLEWNPSPATLPVTPARKIAAALEAGPDVAILLGVNPVHDAPGGGFEKLLGRAKLSVGHGLRLDETLARCTWALPSAHNLESWGDASPLAGVSTLCQPVIAPMGKARQEAESLLEWTKALDGESAGPGADAGAASEAKTAAGAASTAGAWHDWLRARWIRDVLPTGGDSELAWEAALRSGIVGSPARTPFPPLNAEAAEKLAAAEPKGAGEGLDLVIAPHHALLDGRFASSAWLQELPDPVTKLVWDNAALIGPATAERLGLRTGDWVALEPAGSPGPEDGVAPGGAALPVLVEPGVAAGVVATTLGHGRARGGSAGTGHGVNTAPLMGRCGNEITPRLATGVAPRKLGARFLADRALEDFRLVRTQKTFSTEGRPIVRKGTLEEYRENPHFAAQRQHVPPLDQIHGEFDYSRGHKWALGVDLGACTGCSACMIACQAENNVPSVGKEECHLGREMHWIRIDRYVDGDPAEPDVRQQPMTCQQCDNAPCENVCPVNATAHSPEGLNEQVYNRCVGTRYCANNCPYKVRRFNFYDYQDRALVDPVQELAHNPQVTVRARGVMEKCTFCVQRINEVKFRYKNQGRAIPDGAIRTACEQACPARAIVFGDANDPESRVSKVRASALAYHVLEELNVRPNVTYLARLTRPHPDAGPPSAPTAEGDGEGGSHG